VLYQASRRDGESPCLVGFFEGSSARFWSDRTVEERRAEVVSVISSSFKDPQSLHPVHYIEKDWMKEEYSLGGYTGVLPPGVLTSTRVDLAEPFGRIFWAGTETATEWGGYMEGALQSAERAVERIKTQLDLPLPPTLNYPAYPSLAKKQSTKFSLLKVGLAGLFTAAFSYWLFRIPK